MKLFSPYIAKILVVLLLIMVSALPCYSRTYKEIYNLYEEKFRSPKDFEDKNFKNLELIRMDLDVAFYKSAEKRIKWQKDKGLMGPYFKDETEFLEILSLFKQGKLDRELSVGSTEDDYYKYLKKLINSRLKYLNNDFHGAYYNVLKTLTEFLGNKFKTFAEDEILLASRSILSDLDQHDYENITYRIKRPETVFLTRDWINSQMQFFYAKFYSMPYYNFTNDIEFVDKIYLQERDFIPTDAYRKYWYAKLALAFRNPDTFYPLINALKSNNLNIEGTPKIPDYMFTIFESWFDIVKYNKIDKSKFVDLNAAREKLPKLDKFRLIADAIYLRALLTFNRIDDAILYIDVLYKKVLEKFRIRKSISTNNYYHVTLADFVVNISLLRVVNFLKENNYEYENILFKIMMLKHYQQSNNEVDNKYSLNKHENTINQKGIFSKYRLLSSLSKELMSRTNDEIFLTKRGNEYGAQDQLPGDYAFIVEAETAINKIERLEQWEKENSLAMQKRLTLKLKDVKNNLNENEVFFMFTHYGFFIHQYCTTRDYQYDSFKEVKEYYKAKESIINAAKNPSIIYPKKDAEYIFDQTFSLLKKCIKNDNQYLTILMDPESIDIPVNSLVVGDEYEYHWFVDKYKYTILPSPNSFYVTKNTNIPNKDYLGIGDPILKKTKKTDLNLVLDGLLVTRGGVDYESIKEMPSLPETYDEIINTAKLFNKTDLLLRENATEKEFRKKVLGDYKIIHFATHGITSKTLENQNLPGLILTPELNGKWFNDGYLSSSEIMEFDLAADLVILSACNTGVNKTRSYVSGFGDLTQSFLIAGAQNVLATQWSIPSVETQKLIEEILKHYKKNPGNLASSYRKGVRAFIKENKFDIHPYYWASFLPIGRSEVFGDKEEISLKNIYRYGDPLHMDAIAEALLHNNYIYAAGQSLRMKPSTSTGFKNQKLIKSKLLRLNIANDEIDEIDIAGYDDHTYMIHNVIDNQLIISLTKIIATSDNPKENSADWSIGKYNLESGELKFGFQRTFTKEYKLRSLLPFHYIYSPHNDKHYLINAQEDDRDKNILDQNQLVIYSFDSDLKLESELKIPFRSPPDDYYRFLIIPAIHNKKLHIYLQNYRKDQTEKNCDVQFTQSYIIDEKNNYTMGKKYENILFSARSVPLKSRYIPVIKHKDITGSYGSLCFDEYFDVFDLEKNEFKNINYRFPLEVVKLLHFVSTGKKFVLVSNNEVDYGIDFTQDSPSFSYDKNWNFSYDGAKYSLHHNNIIIFDDNFKIINNVTLSSRSYTGIESVVSTDNESVYFFGAKDNLMSIDKLTGF